LLEGSRHPADDGPFGIGFRDAHVDPSLLRDGFVAPDVALELADDLPMVITVVLGGHLDVPPSHVQLGDELPVLVVDRDLRFRSRKARSNQE
jgi:hypothetical protein